MAPPKMYLILSEIWTMTDPRQLHRLVDYAAHLMDLPAASLEFRDGAVRPRAGKGPSYSVKDLAGRAHWNTESLPEGMEPALQATADIARDGQLSSHIVGELGVGKLDTVAPVLLR